MWPSCPSSSDHGSQLALLLAQHAMRCLEFAPVSAQTLVHLPGRAILHHAHFGQCPVGSRTWMHLSPRAHARASSSSIKTLPDPVSPRSMGNLQGKPQWSGLCPQSRRHALMAARVGASVTDRLMWRVGFQPFRHDELVTETGSLVGNVSLMAWSSLRSVRAMETSCAETPLAQENES